MKAGNVEITHPDKALFGKSGYSKAELADYFERIASWMLPWLENRPLTLRHFPEGIGNEGFFSKHAPGYFPAYIERARVPMHSDRGNITMVTANETADLVYFAGQNVIEIHTALSAINHPEKPDQLVFDLDPSDGDFEKVRKSARRLRDLLDETGLPSYIKTTGSRGVHVHIPLRAEKNFREVKPVAEELAEKLVRELPDITTLEQRKKKRGDRVYIDVLRNDHGMTIIAPYSPRALEGAPVATPIDWRELGRASMHPRRFTIKNIFRRLSQKEDPWRDFPRRRVGPGKPGL